MAIVPPYLHSKRRALYTNLVLEIDEVGFNSSYLAPIDPENDDDFAVELQQSQFIEKAHKVQKVDSVLSNAFCSNNTQCPFCQQSIPGYYVRVRDKSDGTNEIITCPECGVSIKPAGLIIFNLKKNSNIAKKYIKMFSLDDDTPLEQVIWRYKVAIGLTKKFCFMCNLYYKNYRTHLKVHEGRTAKCDVCGLQIKETRMKFHIRNRHESSSEYFCDICGKLLSNRSKIRHHKIIHEEKQHKCEICDKKFHFFDRLERHLRVHTGEQPFQCDQCGQRFTLKWNLLQHKRKHTNEMPYNCSYCDRSFRYNVSRKSHIVAAHPGKKLPDDGVDHGSGRPKRPNYQIDRDKIKKGKTKVRRDRVKRKQVEDKL